MADEHVNSSLEAVLAQRAAVAENLTLLSGVGADVRLARLRNGQPETTEFYKKLLEAVQDQGFRLIVLDPISRFYGLDENNNGHATYFCSLLERLAKETGATVLCSHHMNKMGEGQGRTALEKVASRLGADRMRGASAFSAAVRWQAQLVALAEGERDAVGAEIGEAWRYVALAVPKVNYGPGLPGGIKFMKRGDGGVLMPCTPKPRMVPGLEKLPDMILEAVADLEAQGKRMTRKTFSEAYAAKWKPEHPKVSGAKIKDAISLLLLEERLSEVNGTTDKGRAFDYLQISSPKGDGGAS